MVRQAVCRIVGSAERSDIELAKNAEYPQVVGCQQVVAMLPDLFGIGLVEQAIEAEVALQLKVAPVVERVAQGVRHGLGPRQELVMRVRLARAIGFAYAVGPHGAPLVVVALEPDLE